MAENNEVELDVGDAEAVTIDIPVVGEYVQGV